jgi:glucokinase
MRALAIDLGGTHAGCGVVENSRILAHESFDTARAKSLAAFLPKISDVLRALVRKAGLALQDFSGIAVGMLCIVASRAMRPLATHGKYDDAKEIDLSAWGRNEFGLPLRLENDARMALLGECFGGVAQGYSDVVMMTLGTGIGGVVMMERKLIRVKHFQAGCLGGHLPVLFNGRRCTCGNVGCAEAEASGDSLTSVVNTWPGVSESSLSKYSTLVSRSCLAMEVRDRCLKIWAADAVAMIHANDPEILVIGGGVMKSADVILPVIEAHVHHMREPHGARWGPSCWIGQ